MPESPLHRMLPQFSAAPNARHAPARKAAKLPGLQSVKVLDQLRERIRYLHYSRRTEEAYVYWVRAFIRFHGLRHPNELGGHEVEQCLCCLVKDGEEPSAKPWASARGWSPPIAAQRACSNKRLISPLFTKACNSVAPPIKLPATNTIGNVDQPLHSFSAKRGFHWLK